MLAHLSAGNPWDLIDLILHFWMYIVMAGYAICMACLVVYHWLKNRRQRKH